MTDIGFSEIQAWVSAQLTGNDVLVGLVFGGLLASLIYSVRSVVMMAGRILGRQFTCTLRIDNTDPMFGAFTAWVLKQPFAQHSRRLASAHWQGSRIEAVNENGEEEVPITIGPGNHWFMYCGRPVRLEFNIAEKSTGQFLLRTYDLTLYGRRPDLLRKMIQEAKDAFLSRDEVKMWVWCYGWRRISGKNRRPLSSLVDETGEITELAEDAQWFLDNADWYRSRGVPYRRGYLLHGPPGTGKSSAALVLASELDLPLYHVNLASIRDDGVMAEILIETSDGILLLEDIDRIKLQAEGGENEGVTMGGLLNALDGVSAPEGRILMMTSNTPAEKMEGALVRPGRIDRQIFMGQIGIEGAERMYRRFFANGAQAEARHFAEENAPDTPAALQEKLIRDMAV